MVDTGFPDWSSPDMWSGSIDFLIISRAADAVWLEFSSKTFTVITIQQEF